MVIKFRKRSVNNQITRPTQFEAKIDIGKRIRQAFIEPAGILKNFAASTCTCRRLRCSCGSPAPGDLLRDVLPENPKSRLGNSVYAENDSGMFDCVIRIQYPCTDRANLGRWMCSAMIVNQSFSITSTSPFKKSSHGLSVCSDREIVERGDV